MLQLNEERTASEGRSSEERPEPVLGDDGLSLLVDEGEGAVLGGEGELSCISAPFEYWHCLVDLILHAGF